MILLHFLNAESIPSFTIITDIEYNIEYVFCQTYAKTKIYSN